MRWPFWECVYPQRGDAYDCVQLYTVGQSSGRFVLEWHYLCEKLSTFVNLRYFHLWLLWFSIPNGIKDGIGGKLGMFASNEYFFPREGEKLRENVLPSSFEKNFPSFLAFWSKKTLFTSKHAQLFAKYGMACLCILAVQNSILNPQNLINFQIWKIENSTKIINFSIKYAQQFTKWGMFQISIFLIFKSCPVCFFENSRFWPEKWGKKWNLPQGSIHLLEG